MALNTPGLMQDSAEEDLSVHLTILTLRTKEEGLRLDGAVVLKPLLRTLNTNSEELVGLRWWWRHQALRDKHRLSRALRRSLRRSLQWREGHGSLSDYLGELLVRMLRTKSALKKKQVPHAQALSQS